MFILNLRIDIIIFYELRYLLTKFTADGMEKNEFITLYQCNNIKLYVNYYEYSSKKITERVV